MTYSTQGVMRRHTLKHLFISLMCVCLVGPFSHLQAQSDGLPRGATDMPYTRYEAESGSWGGGATYYDNPTFDPTLTAAEASDQQYVGLPSNGSYVEWTIGQGGDGVVVRFTLPDSPSGGGNDGSLDIYVNGIYVQTVGLTSYWAWQYFPHTEPENVPAANPRMRFDEARFVLSSAVGAGDVLRIEKTNGDSFEYGIDFVEIETIPAALPKPAGYFSIADFGAIPNDTINDLGAFYAALFNAENAGTGVYIPAGFWKLENRLELGYDSIALQGAGMWHTEIFFSETGFFKGGILGYGTEQELSHFYMNTANNSRFLPNGSPAEYKGFNGHYGNNTSIHDTWIAHFSAGAWIGDYTAPITATQNLQFYRNRVRNTYADGLNYTQGTSNSFAYQNNFRNNGDDAMAIWPTNGTGVIEGVNNEFYNNTIEFTYRAGGIACFGGDGHSLHHNVVKDNFGGAGIRLTTDFPGFNFTNTALISVYENTIIASGISVDLFGLHRGAVEINSSNGPVQNVVFDNLDIIRSKQHAIQVAGIGSDLDFNHIRINGTGLDHVTSSNYSVQMGGAAVSVVGFTGTVDIDDITLANVERNPPFFNENSAFNLNITNVKDGNKRPVLHTHYLDFGPDDGTNGNATNGADTYGHFWNNVVNNSGSSPAINLVDADSSSRGLSLQLMNTFGRNGILNGGLLAPDSVFMGDLAIASATEDYFFMTGPGSLEISGLDTGIHYVVHLFGTRNSSSTRVSALSVSGQGNTYEENLQTSGTDLGGSGYNGNRSAILVSDTLKADVNGKLTVGLDVASGGFAYLGAMKIEAIGPTNQPPTANAGPDYTISYTVNSLTLTGNGTDPEGGPLAYTWTQVSGPTATISPADSAQITVSGLYGGQTYVFQLSVDDGIDVATDQVSITVEAGPAALLERSYFVDFGRDNGLDGDTTVNPDANGHYWNNVVQTASTSPAVSLIDGANQNVGASLQLLSNFSSNGKRNGGLLSPDAALLGEMAISTATEDYFFTTGTASFEISGLDTTLGYVFHLFGTRQTTSTRVSEYTLTGAGSSYVGTLQTSGAGIGEGGYDGNNDNVLVSDTLFPDANGKLTLSLAVDQGGFAYLGLMKLEEISFPNHPQLSGANVAWRYAYGSSHKFVSYSTMTEKQSIDKIAVSGTIGGILSMGTSPEYLKISALNGEPSVKQLEHAVISQKPTSNGDAQWISGDEVLVYQIGADLAGQSWRAVKWQLRAKVAGQQALITTYANGQLVGSRTLTLTNTSEYYALEYLGHFDEIRLKAVGSAKVKLAGGTDNHLPEGPGYTMNRFYLVENGAAKQSQPLAEEMVASGAALVAYPNPAREEIFLTNEQPVQVELYNSMGQLVRLPAVLAPGKSLNLSNLPQGVYVLKVEQEGEVQPIRIWRNRTRR